MPPTGTETGVQYSDARWFYSMYTMKQQLKRKNKKFPSSMRLTVYKKTPAILPNTVVSNCGEKKHFKLIEWSLLFHRVKCHLKTETLEPIINFKHKIW